MEDTYLSEDHRESAKTFIRACAQYRIMALRYLKGRLDMTEHDVKMAFDALVPKIPLEEAQQLFLRRACGIISKFPEDWQTAKDLQIDGWGIPSETNMEMAIGAWVNTVRPALFKTFREVLSGSKKEQA